MIFSDPDNRGNGRLTKTERVQLGSTVKELGHNPNQELSAEVVMQALLLKAAAEHDAKNPDDIQVAAAQKFIERRNT